MANENSPRACVRGAALASLAKAGGGSHQNGTSANENAKDQHVNSSISLAGLALIQEFEGFHADPAALPDGNWVVGYNHVRQRDPGAKVSQGDAVDLLARDLVPFIQMVNKHVTTPLTPSQFDALVSFAFSIGADAFVKSQVLRRVNKGAFLAAGCAMEAWRKADVNGDLVVSEALVRRRAAEKALFLKELPIEAAPSALLRPQLDYAAAVLGAPVEFTETPKLDIAITPPVIDLDAIETRVASEAAAAADALRALQAEAEAQARAEAEALAQARAKAEAEAAARAQAIAFADAQLALQSKPADGAIITRILMSEPATADVLLLTQVIVEDVADDEAEIVTAHAKPVARQVGFARSFKFAWPDLTRTADSFALAALLLVGLGLIAIASTMLFSGPADFVDVAAAAALATPGLAATSLAAYAIWRAPKPQAIEA